MAAERYMKTRSTALPVSRSAVPSSRWWKALCALALVGWPVPSAFAEPRPDDDRRPLPDYDGRPPESDHRLGDAVLWVPRLVLSPLYLVSEYIVRRPLSLAVPAADRRDYPRRIYDFFTFGPDHNAGFLPVGFVEFDLQPSYGVYVYWHDALVKGNDLAMHVETWTSDWLMAALTQRLHFARVTFEIHLKSVKRPDYPFYGIGPETVSAERSRYGAHTVESGAALVFPFWRSSRLEVAGTVRKVSFFRGWHDDDPALDNQVTAGVFPLPEGLDTGYTAALGRLTAIVDSRRPWPSPGSGVRLKVQMEQGNELQHTPFASWLRTDALAGAFYDLNGYRRVLSLSVATAFVDPLGQTAVPFTELVALGGNGLMRGFPWLRLLGSSAAVATVRYEWPIGPWVTGNIQAAVGNVFGPHLQGFQPDLLRMSWALGLSSESLSTPDYPLELLVGMGTETFAQGGRIDSVRLAVGVNYGL